MTECMNEWRDGENREIGKKRQMMEGFSWMSKINSPKAVYFPVIQRRNQLNNK